MLILQLLPTIAYGDAVSNDALALERVIKRMGYKTSIYAEAIDQRFEKGVAKTIDRLPKLGKNDIVIYHLSTGSKVNWDFGKLTCKKVLIYHNITPSEHLVRYNLQAAQRCDAGIDSARWLANNVDYCIAVSEFNKRDLINLGFRCKIDVLPILIPFDDYKKKPNDIIMRRYNDSYTNILFTGRVTPNKKQEDVILAFHHYKKYFNPKSRLFLVGSSNGYENYRKRLEAYINVLGVEDVVMAGHVKFDEILAYYNSANIFLCQSEHEGFCVPLVEAMYFDIPVVAYDSSAIADTLGGSGILMTSKNPSITAGMIDHIVRDENLRNQIIHNQRTRLQDFDHKVIEDKFVKLLTENVINARFDRSQKR